MRNAKNVARKAFRREFGFSPKHSDITIIECTQDKDKYLTIFCSVSELVEQTGKEQIRAPKRYYLLEYDGIFMERVDENCRKLNGEELEIQHLCKHS